MYTILHLSSAVHFWTSFSAWKIDMANHQPVSVAGSNALKAMLSPVGPQMDASSNHLYWFMVSNNWKTASFMTELIKKWTKTPKDWIFLHFGDNKSCFKTSNQKYLETPSPKILRHLRVDEALQRSLGLSVLKTGREKGRRKQKHGSKCLEKVEKMNKKNEKMNKHCHETVHKKNSCWD